MGYATGDQITYSFGPIDFGAGDSQFAIRGPNGLSGRITDVIVSVTETFTNVTTQAFVRVGTAADNDRDLELGLGTAAIGTSVAASADPDNFKRDEVLEPDTDIIVNLVAPTGGTPAGIGYIHLVVNWF